MTENQEDQSCQSAQAILDIAAAEVGCEVSELPARLSDSHYFFGRELLPDWVAEAWPDMSLDAKAVVILYARELHEQNEEGWFKHW